MATRLQPTSATRTTLPNVLYVDCHDLGDWLGCYGRPYVKSPRLDRLSMEGAVCTRYIAAAPICMPSRSAIFTGMMPHQNGVFGQDPLNERFVCLPERLRQNGYETVVAGGLMVLNDPRSIGFERVLVADKDGAKIAAAAAFLRARAQASGDTARPFYLSISLQRVHRPYGLVHDPAVAEAVPIPPVLPDVTTVRRDLATLIHQVGDLDSFIGQLLDTLDDAGLAEDTVVVFTTDHGAAVARAKHTLYDGGIKTALLIRFPGVVQAGRRCDDLLSNLDLSPTLLDLLGFQAPHGILGKSFARRLTGSAEAGDLTSAATGRDAVFAEQTWGRRSGSYYYAPARCIRTARFKYIRNFERQPPYIDNSWIARFHGSAGRELIEERFGAPLPETELYDLDADPHELSDVAPDPAYRDVREALGANLQAFLEQTGDPILLGPIPNVAGEPHIAQWVEGMNGRFHLAPAEPINSREEPFSE